jgi:hypothetical protein
LPARRKKYRESIDFAPFEDCIDATKSLIFRQTLVRIPYPGEPEKKSAKERIESAEEAISGAAAAGEGMTRCGTAAGG